MLPDVVLDAARSTGGAWANVMEGFGVGDTVLGAEGAGAGEDELADVVAVGGDVVVSEEGEALFALGEFLAEARAEVAGGSFGAVGAVSVDDFVDLAADVDDAGDLGTAGEIVFLLDGFGGVAEGDLFREIVGAAGHPAGRFDGAGGGVVVGVFFVVGPGVPADDGVGFEGADEEDEAADDFVEGDVGHAVVVVVEVEVAFAAEDAGDLGVVAFVAEYMFADGAGGAEARGISHIVIGCPYEVSGIALFDQLSYCTRGRERDIVGVGLDGEEDLAFVGLAGDRAFEKWAGGGLLSESAAGEESGDKTAPEHAGIIPMLRAGVTRRG